jgi:PAS domain S-box-containing protein
VSTPPATSLAAESLLSLAVTVTSEQYVQSVLHSIVDGLAAQPGVALSRIWLLPSVHLPSFYHAASDPPDCLCLVASAGTAISSPGEDWSFLQGHFARMRFNVGKVGQVAATRHPILVEDVAAQNDWIVRPEWAKREEIRSFAGHPLIFRDKLLGVIAVFSRQPLGQREFTWLGLFANQAAVAIANACAEEALRSSERNLAALVNTIPTAAWTTRPDGYCDFLNQVWLDHAGMTAEQAAGWGWVEAVHPDDRPKLVEVWQSCLVSGIPLDTEARIRRFDGSYRWFLIRGNPLKDERDNILKWYGTCVDIEDRKRGEEALHARELSWRQIVDNIPGLVATMRAMGEIEFLNRQTLEYFGKTGEELKNWALIDAVHPDDLPRVIEARKRSIETGQIYEIEHRCRRADGVYRWFQVRGLPARNAEGTISAWYLLLTDIDDRKRAEEVLRTRELEVRSFFDNTPGLLARLSPDGIPEIFNPPFLHYLGRTPQEIGQWRMNDIVHPDDLAHTIEVFGNALSTGQPFEFEYRLRRFDGVYRWFQARVVPVRNVEGQILHWNALVTDIDDRKKAEEALQSSERNLSLMINVIPTVIAVLGTDGSMLYANQTALDYTGLTLEDVQKKDSRSRIFHPEDVETLREERGAALTLGVPFENEQRVLGKDGRYRWFLVRYNPLLDEQGRIDRWYVAAADIEDRKRAEARVEQAYLRLTEAQQLSKTGSFITDLLMDEHDWSEEAFRIFEFDPAAKVTVERIRNTIHPEDLPTFEAVIARGMTGADVEFGFRIVTSRGTVKHLRGMARVMAQSGGRPLFIGAMQDDTQRKLAEEALDKARSELAHVARIATLNALTASIAHEVNQPLSGIITNASTCRRMLDGDPPNIEGARETARRIIRDGNRASDVISRLRVLFSKKDFTLEPLDLNEATREVIALSLSDLQRNRVVLLADLAEDLPPVIGDRVQLQQVILNLVRNASDAMLGVDGRPKELLIKTAGDESDRVRLSVIDAGVGFSPETADKLFEAFHTTKSDGMGIGLSVSRSIIERHHGRLWAEANAGPGATFSFSIPCGPERVTAAAPERGPASAR